MQEFSNLPAPWDRGQDALKTLIPEFYLQSLTSMLCFTFSSVPYVPLSSLLTSVSSVSSSMTWV